MWISKKEYRQLKERAEFWEEEYEKSNINKTALFRSLSDELKYSITQINELNKQLTELQEYKQKYADEVQKRLELVKLLENTP